MAGRDGERGIALVLTLLIVSLLSILVVEFTDSVQVESHLSRNALSSLQATYLARSGINIMAAALVLDKTPNVDPDVDDPWRSFVLDGCSTLPSLELPPNWHMCVRIADESGKLNLNMTKPSSLDPDKTQLECHNGNEVCWRDSLQRLLDAAGLDGEDVSKSIEEYWLTPTTDANGNEQQPPYFDSVDGFASTFPSLRNRAAFQILREFTTAVRGDNQVIRFPVNINTAPPEVLAAILNDAGAAQDIVSRRSDQPCQSVSDCLGGATVEGGTNQFTTRSAIFRLEASASVNGIGKTVRALVRRRCNGQQQADQPPCSLEYWEWQKEGGAPLFKKAQDVDGDLAAAP